MIWIMLATLAVVFVIGFRVLTSGSRRAIRRLSERLNIDVVAVESMIDQMGKVQGEAFMQYLHRPDESHLQVRLALGFLREVDPDMQDINAFQMRYNAFFQPEDGVHWLH